MVLFALIVGPFMGSPHFLLKAGHPAVYNLLFFLKIQVSSLQKIAKFMKETIVLIHGYGFDSSTWSPVEMAFDDFNVIQLSLPGFGEQTVEEPYSINALAQRFWLDLATPKDARIHLVGHSMGGYVCLEMIAQQPHLVASLALVHSHVYADSDDKKAKRTTAIEEIKKAGRDSLVRKMIPSFFNTSVAEKYIAEILVARGLEYNDHAWYFGMEAMRDRKDHSETLRKTAVPVLMIMGEKDEAVPVSLAYQQAALSDRCKLCVYPESRHMAMYDNTVKMIHDLHTFYRAI